MKYRKAKSKHREPRLVKRHAAREQQRAQPVAAVKPASDDFLRSYEWRRLRMKVLIARGRRCECCGVVPTRENGRVVQVDHIKPRRTHPELALVEANLQVLCDECNHGKGNWETDWREPVHEKEVLSAREARTVSEAEALAAGHPTYH